MCIKTEFNPQKNISRFFVCSSNMAAVTSCEHILYAWKTLMHRLFKNKFKLPTLGNYFGRYRFSWFCWYRFCPYFASTHSFVRAIQLYMIILLYFFTLWRRVWPFSLLDAIRKLIRAKKKKWGFKGTLISLIKDRRCPPSCNVILID